MSQLNYLVYLKRPLDTPDPQEHFLHVLVYSQDKSTVESVQIETRRLGFDVLLTQQQTLMLEENLEIFIKAGNELVGEEKILIPNPLGNFQRDFEFLVDKRFETNDLASLECSIVTGKLAQMNTFSFHWTYNPPHVVQKTIVNVSGEQSVGCQYNHQELMQPTEAFVPNAFRREVFQRCRDAHEHMTCFHLLHLAWPLFVMFLRKGGVLEQLFNYHLPPAFPNRTYRDDSRDINMEYYVLLEWGQILRMPLCVCVFSFLFPRKGRHMMFSFSSFFAFWDFVFSKWSEASNPVMLFATFMNVIPGLVLFDLTLSFVKCILGLSSSTARILSYPWRYPPGEVIAEEKWNIMLHAVTLLLHYVCIYKSFFHGIVPSVDSIDIMIVMSTSAIVAIYSWQWIHKPQTWTLVRAWIERESSADSILSRFDEAFGHVKFTLLLILFII